MNPLTPWISITRRSLCLAALVSLCSCGAENEGSSPSEGPLGDATPASRPASDESPATTEKADGVYALQLDSLGGEVVDLSSYAGKVSLVVNVASRCGYTPQYAGLQKLHQELSSRGFQVLGFPCNDFGGQEPGSAAEIQAFCSDKYDVSFPLFAKVKIKGDERSPLYAHLIEKTGETPNWNFCKYLVGKNGDVLGFWNSSTTPSAAELRTAIEAAL